MIYCSNKTKVWSISTFNGATFNTEIRNYGSDDGDNNGIDYGSDDGDNGIDYGSDDGDNNGIYYGSDDGDNNGIYYGSDDGDNNVIDDTNCNIRAQSSS